MKKLRRLAALLLLCVCGVAVIRVLAFDNGPAGGQTNRDEETIAGWIIERIAAGEIDLTEEESVRSAIAEGEKEFDIVLTKENEDRIVGFTRTLDTLEAGADDFVDRAKQMYGRYAAEFVEQANDRINGAFKAAARDAANGFVESLFSEEDE